MKKDRIFTDKIKGITENCRDCREKADMFASGYINYSPRLKKWTIEFMCNKCHEISDIWLYKYKDLIDEAVQDADRNHG